MTVQITVIKVIAIEFYDGNNCQHDRAHDGSNRHDLQLLDGSNRHGSNRRCKSNRHEFTLLHIGTH